MQQDEEQYQKRASALKKLGDRRGEGVDDRCETLAFYGLAMTRGLTEDETDEHGR
jgi:hypothetical protein